MRKLISAVVLALLAGNASAAWTLVDDGARKATYLEMDSIRRSNESVKVFALTDYKVEQTFKGGTRYFSTVILYEFDCADQRRRALQAAAYSEITRGGTRVFNITEPSEWEYVEPGTIDDAKMRVACKK
jgi:hypothetical protein